jgi:hypothetical protein
VLAIWVRTRADLRARFRSWLGLMLLVGVAGGATIAVAVGARRTDTAYGRFLTTHTPSDVNVLDSSDFVTKQVDLDAVAALPQITYTARATILPFVGRTGNGRLVTSDDMNAVALLDHRFGNTIDRWKVLRGRAADATRAGDAVLDFDAADRLHLDVGDTVTLRFSRRATFDREIVPYFASMTQRVAGEPHAGVDFTALADGPPVTVRIVGIVASAGGFPPIPGQLRGFLQLTPAFAAKHLRGLTRADVLFARLRPGTDISGFKAAVERLSGGSTVFFGITQRDHAANVERSLHLQAVVLYLLAVLIGAAALLAIAQALSRQSFLESVDYPTLRALGITRRGLWAMAMLRTIAIAGIGAFLAVGFAVLLSPLWPLGLARVAEPFPGFEINALMLATAGAVLAVLVIAVGVEPAWRSSRLSGGTGTHAGTGRPAVVRGLHRTRLPLPAVLGVRQALEPGRGSTAVPVRSTMLTAVLAVATLATAMTFGSSLDHLVATPRLYGWAWDVQLGAEAFPDLADPVAAGLAKNPAVGSFSTGTAAEIQVNHARVAAFAVDAVQGHISPALLEGRAPTAPDEIVLGTQTLDAVHAHVGGHVSVRVGAEVRRFRVVGRGVFPNIGDSGQLGRGAFVTHAALRRSAPNAPRNIVLVRFAPGADRAAALAQLRTAVAPFPVTSASLPNDLVSFGRVDDLPLVAAAVLGLIAVAVLAHTLVTAIRRRQRDLAILKTLGFVRRQVAGTIAGQATTLALVALAVGLPLGVATGRIAWSVFADRQGIRAPATVNLWALALVIPATLVVAMLIAAIPARIAAHTRPLTTLRAE